ncbi:MAG: hypothetical protein IJB75_03215 [Oscillospiraceae bacterium]|nr:hypothetical protein [Oscillospiraceae bacterium]
MERFTRRMINTILLCLIAIAVAVVIWDALPGLIKILAIGGVVCGALRIFKN